MPRQLDRIQKAKAYHNHPLRKEYEAKKAEITAKNKGVIYYIFWFLEIFSIIMIPGYFIIFIFDDILLNRPLLIIILGIANLMFPGFLFALLEDKVNAVQKNRNKDELSKLQNEYEKKGLYEFTENDLISRCLDEGYDCEPICGVTGAYIGYGQKYYFCKEPRNCLKCKTFMKAYLGNDWDGEYEME